jgi:hypothetical protein
MRKHSVLKILLAICFIFASAPFAFPCWDCNDDDGGGDINIGDYQTQEVEPSTYAPNGNVVNYSGNQGIWGDGWSGGDFNGEAEAFKAQLLAWKFDTDTGYHFGSSLMELYGKFTVTPDCPEGAIDVTSYAVGETNTSGDDSGDGLSMASDLLMSAGGQWWGFGGDVGAGIHILFEMGSYQEFGDPDDLANGPFGWQFNKSTIEINGGEIPDDI